MTNPGPDPAPPQRPEPAPGAPATVVYTCPMHPQIRRNGPGACPICGMTLEPLTVALETGPGPERIDMTRRFWAGVVLTVPLMALAMGAHLSWLHLEDLVPARVPVWVQFVLASPVVLWAGWPFFVRGWASVVHRSLNMFSLIALGTGTAYLYSVVATVAPGLFPAGLRMMDGTVAVYFEAAAVITVLVLLGQVLELRAHEQTGGAIRALLDLAPKTARRLTAGGDDEDIPLEQVQAGDRLRVRPGDSVPVDGVVLEGHSNVDEAMITGEAMPVAKTPGARLIGGTINGTGALVMRAERDRRRHRAGAHRRHGRRGAAQPRADPAHGRHRLRLFRPAVIAVALLAFIAWSIWGPPPAMAYGLVAAVSVLIIACPCALGLATPMSIMVGIGRGAIGGVLIKSAEALERMEKVDTLVVDKTGTLTEGKPRVVAVIPAGAAAAGDRCAGAGGEPGAVERTPAGGRDRGGGPGRGHRRRGTGRLRLDHRQGRHRHGRRPRRGAGQRPAAGRSRHRSRRPGRTGRGAAAATARPRCFCASTASPAASSRSPTRSNPRTADALLDGLRADGIRIVMLTGDNRTTATGGRPRPRHRRRPGRSAAGGQAPHRPRPARRREDRRHGGRRRQRRAGARRGRCRHRHGHRHRRRDPERRHHAGAAAISPASRAPAC